MKENITEINGYKVGDKYIIAYGLSTEEYTNIYNMSLSEIYSRLNIQYNVKDFGLQEIEIKEITKYTDKDNSIYYFILTSVGPMYYCSDNGEDELKEFINLGKLLINKEFNEFYCPQNYNLYCVTYTDNLDREYKINLYLDSNSVISNNYFLSNIYSAVKIVDYKNITGITKLFN